MSDNYYEQHYRQLVGRTITAVAPLSKSDLEAMGWTGYDGRGWVLVLDNGTLVLPMADPEGNGPGHLDIIKEGS